MTNKMTQQKTGKEEKKGRIGKKETRRIGEGKKFTTRR